MDLMVGVILFFGLLLLWLRLDTLGRRSDRFEQRLDELRAIVGDQQRRIDGLAASERSAVPSVAPAVAPVVAAEPLMAPKPLAAATPTARAIEPAPRVARRRPLSVAPAAASRRPAQPIPRPSANEPVAAAPAGPGLAQQLLVRLGLTPPAPGEGLSRAAVEAWLEGRMLAVVGGIALLLGAIFFLSLAFSRGWITEPMRVLIGLVVGAGLLALGELAFSKLRGLLGPVLVAVGIAMVSVALLAATRLYGLVPVEVGLAGSLLAAIAAAAIAIRHDSELVGAFGLIAVLAAPPVLGASATLVTLLFVAAALVGTAAVALFRTWVWLPPLAFLLAAPQLASYVSGEVVVAEAMVAIAGFWLVNVIAAGGEEARHASDRLRATTVTLLLADAAFTMWAGFTVLSGPDEAWRGTFLAVLAVLHLALGAFFLARHGDRHPFGLSVTATGVATLTMVVPVQFGGPPVAIAWAAEAVALAWVAVLRRHPYSGAVAVVLGALAIGHLVVIEYPPADLSAGFDRAWPFVGPEGLTYAFMLAGLVIAAIVVPATWVRVGLAAIGGFLTMYVLPFELSGPALVNAWAALAILSIASFRGLVAPRLARTFVEHRLELLVLPPWAQPGVAATIRLVSRVVRPTFAAIGLAASAGAVLHLLAFDFPVARLGAEILSAAPYVGEEGLALAGVLVALVIVGGIVTEKPVRLALAGLGMALLAYTVTFEIARPHVLLAWVATGLAALFLVRRLAPVPLRPARPDTPAVLERVPYGAAALVVLFGIAQSLWYAPPDQLLRHVAEILGPEPSLFVDERTYVLAILGAAFLVGAWTWREMTGRVLGLVSAALVVAWLLPFELRSGYAVAGWAAFVLGGAWLIRVRPATTLLVGLPAAALGSFGALVSVAVVAPPHRLLVDATTSVPGWLLLTDATVALGAIAIALTVGAFLHRANPLHGAAFIAAGAVTVYLLSVGLVDLFQREIAGRPLEDLQKEAQVGLSILWSVLGLIGFAVGLRLHRPTLRLSGLALLGLATVKVFLVDLAALDVAYRVLSLVGLGVLLLVGAAAYARTQHPHPPVTPKAA